MQPSQTHTQWLLESFPQEVKPNTHFHLMLSLKMNGATPPLPATYHHIIRNFFCQCCPASVRCTPYQRPDLCLLYNLSLQSLYSNGSRFQTNATLPSFRQHKLNIYELCTATRQEVNWRPKMQNKTAWSSPPGTKCRDQTKKKLRKSGYFSHSATSV